MMNWELIDCVEDVDHLVDASVCDAISDRVLYDELKKPRSWQDRWMILEDYLRGHFHE